MAAQAFRQEYGGSKQRALRWIQIQGVAGQLEDVMRASRARKDFMRMEYDNHDRKVRFYVRNHAHNDAIRYCARQMGINAYVSIGIHRWTDRQLLRALIETEEAVRPLYDAGLFEGDYGNGDYFGIDVYAPATDAQYREIKAAAKATKVPFRIRRHAEPMPVVELL